MQLLGTRVMNIPDVFISVCQPCDVGIMKTFKTRLVEQCQSWKVAEYTRLGGTGKIPISGRKQVLEWLSEIRKSFLPRLLKIHSKNVTLPNT